MAEPVSSIGSRRPVGEQDASTGPRSEPLSPGGDGAGLFTPGSPAPAGPDVRGSEPSELEDLEYQSLGLDRKNLDRIKEIESCDSDDGREAHARDIDADLVEEEQVRNSERDSLGDDSYLAAIRRSGWYVYWEAIGLGSRLAWLLDAALWATLFIGLWSQWRELYRQDGEVPVWMYLGLPAAIVAAGLLALAIRGLGRHFAVTRLTILGHVHRTIDRLVRTAGKCVLVAGVLLLALLGMMFFAPSSWSSWVNQASNLLSFAANILLGLAAGIGAHAAWILSLPTLRDTVDCELEMIQRTRRYIRRFFREGSRRIPTTLILILALLLFAGDGLAAERIWVWGIDVSDSMDPAQRAQGIDQLIESAPERAQDLGAAVIQVVKFTEEARLAEMQWVTVPTPLPLDDCRSARPKATVAKGLIRWSARIAKEKRKEAIAECQEAQVALRQQAAAQRQAFEEQLREATRVKPRADVTTQLVPMLDDLTRNPHIVAIDMLTDGVDHSGKSPDQVVIPDHVLVTVVITRPNPNRRRPTLDDVLAATYTWDAVAGITVTTVAEYPGFWRTLGGR